MIAFVASERAAERSSDARRRVVVSGCHDPDDMPVIDFVDTHRVLGMAIKVGATVVAGASLAIAALIAVV